MMTKKATCKFRVLVLFGILCRNLTVWGGSALTPALSPPTLILFLVPHLSCVTSGRGLRRMNTLAHVTKLYTCLAYSYHSATPLGVHTRPHFTLRRMDLGKAVHVVLVPLGRDFQGFRHLKHEQGDTGDLSFSSPWVAL